MNLLPKQRLHCSLVDSVKCALELNFRQASKTIRAFAEEMHTDFAKPFGLKAISLIIYEASAFEVELQGVCRGEFEVLFSYYRCTLRLYCKLLKRGNILLSGFLYIKVSLQQKAFITGSISRKCAFDYRPHKKLIDFLWPCDSSVVSAATQGMTYSIACNCNNNAVHLPICQQNSLFTSQHR